MTLKKSREWIFIISIKLIRAFNLTWIVLRPFSQIELLFRIRIARMLNIEEEKK